MQGNCQCASCCVVRTAIAHGTLHVREQPPPANSVWLPVYAALRSPDGMVVITEEYKIMAEDTPA